MSKEIHVNIGEVKLGRGDATLKALLGSCIGIAVLWPKKNKYALAHCLLAHSPEKEVNFSIGAKYVNQGLWSLLRIMHLRKENYNEVQVVVVGGGNMTQCQTRMINQMIGKNNIDEAIKCIEEEKLEINFQDTGGDYGRKIVIDCSTGEFNITKLSKMGAV